MRDGDPVTVAKLVDEATGLARELPGRAYAINLHTNRYRYLRAFCAAIIAGQCTLMPANRQPHTLRQLSEMFPDSYIIGDTEGDPPFSISDDAEMPDIDPEQLCAIAFTSGSTGVPKPSEKFWRTLRDGALGNRRLLYGDDHSHMNLVATVPPQHMWGMETSVILPLVARLAISDATPFYPQDIVEAIEVLPEPVVLISSPIHLETLLKSGVRPKKLARILTATAPLSRELAASLEDAFQTRVQDVFGCSESGILATRNTSTEELWNYGDLFELYGTAEGIRIRADHLPEDVLLPDVVKLVGERQYRWLGRQSDMVNIAGKRGSIADINHQLRQVAGVVDGVVFAREEQPGRLAGLVVAPDMEVSDVIRDLRDRVDPVFLPRPLYKVAALPRLETGKITTNAVLAEFNRIRAGKAG